jgi:hypothetical protein
MARRVGGYGEKYFFLYHRSSSRGDCGRIEAAPEGEVKRS